MITWEKYYRILLFCTFLIGLRGYAQAQQLQEGVVVTDRHKLNLNLGWKFIADEALKGVVPTAKDYDDRNWELVSIPHTPKLVSFDLDSSEDNTTQKEFLRTVSWYRKTLDIEVEEGHKVFLEFEGVHQVTDVWVNGAHVGQYNVGGYTPFHFDITDFVVKNAPNSIVVKADNRYNQFTPPDPGPTDYIKFGGLYRDVFLVKTNPLHVTFDWEAFDAGVHITTPNVTKSNGTVSIKTTVRNEYKVDKKVKIETMIIDEKGIVVKKVIGLANVPAGQDYTFRQTTGIEEDFHLWSVDQPYLYRVHSLIYSGEEVVDQVENKFGFRWFELVDGKGLLLNGAPIFLVGVNRHQNFPVIGDAVPNALHYQEALQYKEAGMNVVRLSHYTQDDAFMEACDELGLIVYEEAPTWIEWEGDEWFANLEKATRTMIRHHRNHPSIFFWGAGINHRGPVPNMHYTAKEEDPFRLTASASSPWNGVTNSGVTDIYATMDYRVTDFPDGDFFMAMEHGCSPNSESNQFMISRYRENVNSIGAIAWVGADYNHLHKEFRKREPMTNYGVLSAYRVPRPSYYWYQSEMTATAMVHIGGHQASTDGKVRVFSNCQAVALYHDGKLVGTQRPDADPSKKNLKHPSFTFRYNWTKGTVKAVGLNNGKPVVVHSRAMAEEPYQLVLQLNSEIPLQAGGSDLRIVHAMIVDKNGNLVPDFDQPVTFKVSGKASLVDDGKVEFVNPARVQDGVASIYVRGVTEAGVAKITASVKGLKSGSLEIKTVPFEEDEMQKIAPIYDFPYLHIDLGAPEQFVHFEWEEWTSEEKGKAAFTSSKLPAVTFEVSPDTDGQELLWRGKGSVMLGDISFVGADGVHIEKGGLTLTITGLPQGTYVLETYHHNREKGKRQTPEVYCTVKDAKGIQARPTTDHAIGYYSLDNIGERRPIAAKNIIASDGKSPIAITFDTQDEQYQIWLNGFILKQWKN